MSQREHETAEQGEERKIGGMFFPASQQTMVAEPSDGALDDPAMTKPAQRPTILSLIYRQAITAVR
jgi:hypothetical protein